MSLDHVNPIRVVSLNPGLARCAAQRGSHSRNVEKLGLCHTRVLPHTDTQHSFTTTSCSMPFGQHGGNCVGRPRLKFCWAYCQGRCRRAGACLWRSSQPPRARRRQLSMEHFGLELVATSEAYSQEVALQIPAMATVVWPFVTEGESDLGSSIADIWDPDLRSVTHTPTLSPMVLWHGKDTRCASCFTSPALSALTTAHECRLHAQSTQHQFFFRCSPTDLWLFVGPYSSDPHSRVDAQQHQQQTTRLLTCATETERARQSTPSQYAASSSSPL